MWPSFLHLISCSSSSLFSSHFSSTFHFPLSPLPFLSPHLSSPPPTLFFSHTTPPSSPTLLFPLQTLGSLSSRGSTFVYDVPSRGQLEGLQEVTFINDTTNITAEFSLLQSEVSWEKEAILLRLMGLMYPFRSLLFSSLSILHSSFPPSCTFFLPSSLFSSLPLPPPSSSSSLPLSLPSLFFLPPSLSSLPPLQAEPSIVTIPVGDCHPGYKFDNVTQQCVCQDQLNEIVRCDASNRYFYVRVCDNETE